MTVKREEGDGMETQVIYLDVLICTNLLINYLLLLATAKLSARFSGRRRLFLAAALGSLTSLLILLPPIGFCWEMLTRIVSAFVIVAVAFPRKSYKIYGKTVFCFFAVSMGFAGVMFALWMFMAPSSFYIANGIVYFDISAVTLVVLSLTAYLLLSLFHRIFRVHPISNRIYEVRVEIDGKTVKLKGYLDTGNTLRDPFLGTPVAVCSIEKILPILPAAIMDYYERVQGSPGKNGSLLVETKSPARVIPFQTVGGSGLLVAFRPDHFVFFEGGREREVEDILIGITEKQVGGGNYDLLLGRDTVFH